MTTTPLPADDAISRIRFIGLLIGIGGLGLALVSVVTVTEVNLSVFAIIVGMSLAALYRMAFADAVVSIALHVFVGVLLFASAADLCATKCGSLTSYETIMGIRTPLYGMAAHFLVAAALFLGRLRRSIPLVAVAESGSAALIGISVFFATVMATNGSYCASCFASHLAMLIQAMVFFRAFANRSVVIPATTVMALAVIGALGLNAVFHHAIQQNTESGEALVSYLRTNGIALRPAEAPILHAPSPNKDIAEQRDRVIDQSIARQRAQIASVGDPLAGTGVSIEQHNADVERHGRALRGSAEDFPAEIPLPPSVDVVQKTSRERDPGQHASVDPLSIKALRPAAEITVLGKMTAPVELRMIIDPHCSACAKELEELSQLADLMEHGQLSVRLMPIFRAEHGEGPQAAATIMLAAGYVSQQVFIDTVMALFRNQQSIRTAREAIDFIPKSVDSSLLMSIIKERQTEIGAVLTDSKNTQMLRGIMTTPAIWIHRRGNPEPLRTFPNMTTAAVLRIAIDSVLNP